MSNKISSAVKYMQMPNVPKQVLKELADFADNNGKAFPSIQTLAYATCLTTRSIINGLAYLREHRLITQKTGVGGNNIYQIHPENFAGEFKKSDRVYALGDENLHNEVVNDVHQCNTFSSESHSIGSESHSLEVVNDVHPNHHINHQLTINESSLGDSENPPEKPEPDKPKRTTKKQAGINRLVELGCDEKYAHDWMIARKGAELTDSIIENLIEQANKANISIALAVQWSAKKGYQGFKADWYLRDQQIQQPSYQPQKSLNADYWAKFGQPQEPDWSEPIDVTPKKTDWIEGVGYA